MHVEAKEQSLVIFTFKGLIYMNISSWKKCADTDRSCLSRVSLRSDENDNKSVLRVCNFSLTAEM